MNWLFMRITAVLVLCLMPAAPPASSDLTPPSKLMTAFNFWPTEHPKEAGPVDILFQFAPPAGHTELEEFVLSVGWVHNLTYFGDSAWVFRASCDIPYETTLPVVIPPNDTSGITMRIAAGLLHYKAACFFVAREDTVELSAGYPRPKTSPPPKYDPTPEELATEYDVQLDLRDSTDWKTVRGILGALPERNETGFYRMTLSLRKINEIKEAGVPGKFWKDVLKEREVRDRWRKDPRKRQSDTALPQGYIPDVTPSPWYAGIWIDSIDGLISGTECLCKEADSVSFFFV